MKIFIIIVLVILGLIALGSLFGVFAALRLAGRISKEEEEIQNGGE